MIPGPPGPHTTGIPHPAIVTPQVKQEHPHNDSELMHVWVCLSAPSPLSITVWELMLSEDMARSKTNEKKYLSWPLWILTPYVTKKGDKGDFLEE